MIAIVTDSGCDLPADLLEGSGVTVVPLTVRFGDDEYLDQVDLDADGFWALLMSGAPHPGTAAPSVGRFAATFDSLAGSGAEGIVVMCMSAAISATHRAAELAAAEFDRIPVRVIDTRLVSAALGLAVLEAAATAAAGGDLDTVAAAARDSSASCRLFAALDTLEYLRRGGRIGRAQAFFGSLLDVKPLIAFEEGEVAAAGRVRTHRKAVAAVLDRLREVAPASRRVAVLHSDPPDLGEVVAEMEAITGCTVVVARLGPVVGTHAGPGAIGIVYRQA